MDCGFSSMYFHFVSSIKTRTFRWIPIKNKNVISISVLKYVIYTYLTTSCIYLFKYRFGISSSYFVIFFNPWTHFSSIRRFRTKRLIIWKLMTIDISIDWLKSIHFNHNNNTFYTYLWTVKSLSTSQSNKIFGNAIIMTYHYFLHHII